MLLSISLSRNDFIVSSKQLEQLLFFKLEIQFFNFHWTLMLSKNQYSIGLLYKSSMKFAYFLSLLLILKAQIVNNNYFQNFPLNSSLMSSANSAVNSLQVFLNNNFYCPSDNYYPDTQPSSLSLNSQSSLLNVQNSVNFGGFLQANSQLNPLQSIFGTFLQKQAYGIPSLTVDYFNPLPKNFVNMNMLPFVKKYTLYNQLGNIISILSQIKAVIMEYGINNAAIGNNNTIMGSGNIVIGSNDTITGSSNWILTSNFTTADAQDGVLALGNYMIQLTEYNRVLQNPSDVINCISSQQAAKIVNAFWTNTSPDRRYCFFS